MADSSSKHAAVKASDATAMDADELRLAQMGTLFVKQYSFTNE